MHARDRQNTPDRSNAPRALSRNTMSRVGGLLCVVAGVFAAHAALLAQERSPASSEVYVVPIEGIIDLGLAPFVERVLQEAAEAQAAAVVLEINTFGGRVDAAVQIRDALLTAPVRTIAFVNKRAISAGALIALSAERIAMAEGGTIGAATPVQMGQPGAAAQPVEEKTVSYVRKEFRATAESRKRPPLLAEAMVDADVSIPDVIEKGKLLTLTTEEALQHGLADFRADTLESALEQAGLGSAVLRQASPNWAENVVRFLTHPIVSSLLITVGMLGIIIELRTPGFGIPGGLGVASLALFFWGHWLVQLAGWEELLLAAGGIVLLALEIFVIPGFGVAGAFGIVALLAGLIMSVTGGGATAQFILAAAGRVTFSLLFALLASLVLLRLLPRLPVSRRLVLQTDLGAGQQFGAAPQSDLRWLGKRGRASSPLRPAGIAELDGERVDVVSDGELIADKANIPLPFKRAAAIDLAGRNVLEAVQMSVLPKVIETPKIAAVAKDGIQLIAVSRVTVRTNIDRLVGGAGEETIIARVGEGMVSTIGSASSHKNVLENPDHISKHVLGKGLDAGTAYEILSIDIADVDVGENIGAKLQIDQANADKQIAQAKAEERRAMAVALEQEMRARVVEAEAEVPRAMAEAFRQGNLGIMDYYRMKNVQADTSMRDAIAGSGEDLPAGPRK